MSAPCSSPLTDVVKKIVEVAGEGEEGIGTPAGVCARVCAREEASDIASASATVRVVVDPPLVVSSDCTDCDRIDGDGGVSSSCCCCCRCREPCDPNE